MNDFNHTVTLTEEQIRSLPAMSDSINLEVHVDGEFYAGVYAEPAEAWRSAMQYATTVLFRKTAKVEIYEVIRRLVYSKLP